MSATAMRRPYRCARCRRMGKLAKSQSKVLRLRAVRAQYDHSAMGQVNRGGIARMAVAVRAEADGVADAGIPHRVRTRARRLRWTQQIPNRAFPKCEPASTRTKRVFPTPPRLLNFPIRAAQIRADRNSAVRNPAARIPAAGIPGDLVRAFPGRAIREVHVRGNLGRGLPEITGLGIQDRGIQGRGNTAPEIPAHTILKAGISGRLRGTSPSFCRANRFRNTATV